MSNCHGNSTMWHTDGPINIRYGERGVNVPLYRKSPSSLSGLQRSLSVIWPKLFVAAAIIACGSSSYRSHPLPYCGYRFLPIEGALVDGDYGSLLLSMMPAHVCIDRYFTKSYIQSRYLDVNFTLEIGQQSNDIVTWTVTYHLQVHNTGIESKQQS